MIMQYHVKLQTFFKRHKKEIHGFLFEWLIQFRYCSISCKFLIDIIFSKSANLSICVISDFLISIFLAQLMSHLYTMIFFVSFCEHILRGQGDKGKRSWTFIIYAMQSLLIYIKCINVHSVLSKLQNLLPPSRCHKRW